MAEYSNEELTDMLLIYGYCERNGRQSVRVYRERFPGRRVPNHQTFAAVERRLRETGRFAPVRVNVGRQRFVRVAEVEEEILERVDDNPEISTRKLSREMGISKDVINRVTREQQIYPYHKQPVQELLHLDFDLRLRFCQFINDQMADNVNFNRNILFTDEACFTKRGVTNFHNEHVYAEENPHAIKVNHYQHEFKINVWAGIIDNFVIGPAILPQSLNGANYLDHLRNVLPELIEDLPLALRQSMWFMHDGAPPHFTLDVRTHLNQNYPNRWIGRGQDAPVRWPPRSPDITPLDYFLWGTVKSMVYSRPVNTQQELWRRIQDAMNDIRNNLEMMRNVQFSFLRRIRSCIRTNGGHFEHLL